MNLKHLRIEKGFSQQQLAIKLNVSRSTVAMWEAGSSEPNMQMIREISRILGVSINAIFGEPADTMPSKIKKSIPVLGQIPAGIPIEAIEDVLDYEDLSEREANDGFEYFGLRIKGSSMYPEYLDGDTIIVRRQETADTGDDAVVMVNGNDATFKRIKRSADGTILMPVNTADFEPTFYSNALIEALPVRILGICVELRRKKK